MTKKICFWSEPVYSQSQFYQELAKQKWESQLCRDVNLIYPTPWFIFLLPERGPRTRQGKSPAWWRQSFHIRTAWLLFSFVVYSLHLHGQQTPLPQGCQLVGYAPEGFSPWWPPFESHKLSGICAQQINPNFSYTISVESLPGSLRNVWFGETQDIIPLWASDKSTGDATLEPCAARPQVAWSSRLFLPLNDTTSKGYH